MIDSYRKFLDEDKTCLFFLGQAGFLIKNKAGYILSIDPYLSDCVEKLEGNIGFKRLLPKIVKAGEADWDVIITTHEHYDHYDIDSMPILMSNNDKVKLFASFGCKNLVLEQKIDLKRVSFVSPGNTFSVVGFDISFINCDHGDGAPNAVGVIVKTDDKVICEVGDTCFREDYKSEYLSSGKIDILIAPINGTFGNMNEKECAILADILNPHTTIPCHFGMFALHGGKPNDFYNIMIDKKQRFSFMTQGEIMYL